MKETDMTLEELICDDLENRGATSKDLKDELAASIIEHICPIGDEIRRLQGDSAFLEEILAEGAERASAIAEETMKSVRYAMGLSLR